LYLYSGQRRDEERVTGRSEEPSGYAASREYRVPQYICEALRL